MKSPCHQLLTRATGTTDYIKPANVVQTNTGSAKLIDFGLAKIFSESVLVGSRFTAFPIAADTSENPTLAAMLMARAEHRAAPSRYHATLTGGQAATLSLSGEVSMPMPAGTPPDTRLTANSLALMGTPRYIAPELWVGKPASTRTDLYALGLVLWELLAGTPAHAEDKIPDLARAIVDKPLSSIAALLSNIPPAFAAVVDRAVCKNPNERFRSAEEMRDALETAANNLRALHMYADPSRRAPALIKSNAEAVQASLGRVMAHPEFIEELYSRLFSRYPELRSLFPNNLALQSRKLADALQLAVSCLRTPLQLHPMLEELGARHVLYGVSEGDMDGLRGVLLELIAKYEGELMTDALSAMWTQAWNELDEAMRRGMRRAVRNGAVPRVARGSSASASSKSRQPITRYAWAGDVSIAYQTFGKGSIDLVVIPSWVSHCEVGWQLPAYARFFNQLGRIARVTVFDKRGTGMSDRINVDMPMEDRMQDVPAVLDAIGTDSAVLLGIQEGGALASLYAAVHPDRVRKLVLYGSGRRLLATSDYPHGLPPLLFEQVCGAVKSAWGSPLFAEFAAPSSANDPTFAFWWAEYLRHGASPGTALSMLRLNATYDIGPVLPAISVPTLVLHRNGDRMMAVEGARYLADRIPGARYVELSGDDHLPWIGDSAGIVRALKHFLNETVEPDQTTRPRSALVSVIALETVSAQVPIEVERELVRAGAREIMRPGGENLRIAEFEAPMAALGCAEALRRQGRLRRALVHTAARAEGMPEREQPTCVARAALDSVPEDMIAATSPAVGLIGGARIRIGEKHACPGPAGMLHLIMFD